MLIYIWKMRARKKKVEDYEKFGRQVTLPTLKKMEGCRGAHFIRTVHSRRPEYLWLVFWTDRKALERARTSPLWRDQLKKFKAGNFHKAIPLELLGEGIESFFTSVEGPKPPAAPNPPKKRAGSGSGAKSKAKASSATSSRRTAPRGE